MANYAISYKRDAGLNDLAPVYFNRQGTREDPITGDPDGYLKRVSVQRFEFRWLEEYTGERMATAPYVGRCAHSALMRAWKDRDRSGHSATVQMWAARDAARIAGQPA